MAARKSFLFFGVPESITPMTPSGAPQFEFEESDVWSNNSSSSVVNDGVSSSDNTRRSSIPSSRAAAAKKSSAAAVKARGVDRPASLPVNIPDWSKILGGEYKDRRRESDEEEEDDGDGDDRVPPHVYLARTRVASLSVHEGIGRTLKGRDLSRVRNAIWKQTGFED
ncbi:PREDICTED: uncharacterized protein LOC109185866 [Ipomoea nil]|uniref:uncharacterized protein LOC109185866 n=1 Tax=Ipomoea nil TaxID=35883 RepID=UPI000900B9A5|nr:PREDICTED: uncharacterized protein LOC109185866 [Ipomoea nil]